MNTNKVHHQTQNSEIQKRTSKNYVYTIFKPKRALKYNKYKHSKNDRGQIMGYRARQ